MITTPRAMSCRFGRYLPRFGDFFSIREALGLRATPVLCLPRSIHRDSDLAQSRHKS